MIIHLMYQMVVKFGDSSKLNKGLWNCIKSVSWSRVEMGNAHFEA